VEKLEEIVVVVANFHYQTVIQVNVMEMDQTTVAQIGDSVDLELIIALAQLAKIIGQKVKS